MMLIRTALHRLDGRFFMNKMKQCIKLCDQYVRFNQSKQNINKNVNKMFVVFVAFFY